MDEEKKTITPKATADGVPVYCSHDAVVDTIKMVPNPANPNKHPDDQIKLLAKIIKASGWRQPITVSKRSGFIVKGHGRLMAAQLAGFKQVPVDYQEYASEAEEYADLIADNRIAELAEIDQKMLADIFAEIDTGEIDFDQTGYTDQEVEQLVTSLAESLHQELDVDSNANDAPEAPAEPVTQYGDIWILGDNRVMCGNSTSADDRALLLDGAAPEILLTDPPYCSGGQQESKKSVGSIGTVMAKEKPVTVVEINEDTKIDYEQNGTKLTFDDQLMINVAKYQKGFPVHVDICMDADRNLCTGVAAGLFYVAQLDIPAIKYEEQTTSENDSSDENGMNPQTPPAVIPLDMSDVTLTLWSIDQLTPATEE